MKPVQERRPLMDAKGLEFLNLNAGVASSIRLTQKSDPVIKPVEGIKKTSRNGTASDAGKQEDSLKVTWLPVPGDEKDAQLASDILAENLVDSPELEVGWRYDRKRRMLIVEVKDTKSGEIVRRFPPEDILNALHRSKPDGSGTLLNGVA